MVQRTKFIKMMNVGRQGGFHSRSSVFRILNKYGINLNLGKYSDPIKKKGERKNSQDKQS